VASNKMALDTKNLQFQQILQDLEKGDQNLLILGKAGTGKSSLLTHFVKNTEAQVALVAPTGIAAINIGGETIHSFFKLPFNYNPDEVAASAKRLKQRRALYKALEILIIDEISMVRADLLDMIDIFLRTARGSKQPFGGVRVVMFGDLHQLPPVVTKGEESELLSIYKTPYFFSSQVFKKLLYGMFVNLKYYSLDKIYRQEDEDFIGMLHQIRSNSLSEENLDKLNQRVAFDESILYEQDKAIILTTTNRIADHINMGKLADLGTSPQNFMADATGRFAMPGATYPNAQELVFKVGSRVMFLNNDQDKRWVNGHLGTIKDFYRHKKSGQVGALVAMDDGREEIVLPHTWEVTQSSFNLLEDKIDRQVIGTYTQLPLKLAWAVTIHKSQGKTFDKIIINLGAGTFAPGQTYVALSRATSLQGITLTRALAMEDIKVDPVVEVFISEVERLAGE
jgi:ATP-dependent exoDNAse (exonuclease V) alpha subunit